MTAFPGSSLAKLWLIVGSGNRQMTVALILRNDDLRACPMIELGIVYLRTFLESPCP